MCGLPFALPNQFSSVEKDRLSGRFRQTVLSKHPYNAHSYWKLRANLYNQSIGCVFFLVKWSVKQIGFNPVKTYFYFLKNKKEGSQIKITNEELDRFFVKVG